MFGAKRLTKSHFFKIIAGLFTAMGFTAIGAFAQLGEIVPSVPCLENEAQTYALFRPANYTRKKRWPAILLLDAKGQGQPGVEAFQKGAASYGFILASPNGLLGNQDQEKQDEIVRQIFEDIIRRFAVDIEAVYVGGVGKASRPAIDFAKRIQTTPGLVLSSPEPSTLEALENYPRLLAMAIGTQDANAFSTQRWFADHARSDRQRLLRFRGATQWTPPETGEEILGWMALRQWRTRPETEPETGLSTNYEIRTGHARNLEAERWWTQALERWQTLTSDFPEDTHQPTVQAVAKRLAKSPSLKEQMAAEAEASRMEGQVLDVFQKHFQPDVFTSHQALADNLAWWEAQMNSLRHIANLPGNNAKKHAALRLIEWLWRRSYLDGLTLLEKKHYQRAAYHQRLASDLFPDQAFAHYAHACALAGLNQPEAAIGALEKSLNSGLDQPDLLRLQPLFDPIRGQEAFVTLLDRLKSKGD